MTRFRRLRPVAVASTLLFLLTPVFAQFSAGIKGVVQDPTGSAIPKASVELVNNATGSTAVTESDTSGNYQFVSLAPGNYKITVHATGFSKTEAEVTLLTAQS